MRQQLSDLAAQQYLRRFQLEAEEVLYLDPILQKIFCHPSLQLEQSLCLEAGVLVQLSAVIHPP